MQEKPTPQRPEKKSAELPVERAPGENVTVIDLDALERDSITHSLREKFANELVDRLGDVTRAIKKSGPRPSKTCTIDDASRPRSKVLGDFEYLRPGRPKGGFFSKDFNKWFLGS